MGVVLSVAKCYDKRKGENTAITVKLSKQYSLRVYECVARPAKKKGVIGCNSGGCCVSGDIREQQSVAVAY